MQIGVFDMIFPLQVMVVQGLTYTGTRVNMVYVLIIRSNVNVTLWRGLGKLWLPCHVSFCR